MFIHRLLGAPICLLNVMPLEFMVSELKRVTTDELWPEFSFLSPPKIRLICQCGRFEQCQLSKTIFEVPNQDPHRLAYLEPRRGSFSSFIGPWNSMVAFIIGLDPRKGQDQVRLR